MRRPFPRATGAVLLAGAFLVAAPVAAAPPDDDDGAAALQRFEDLAADVGLTLVDPACSSSPSGGVTYTCYAMTTDGSPFIARTTMSAGDVVEFEIIAQPGTTPDAGAPSALPAAEPAASFDPLAYFAALFSGDPEQVATVRELSAPGSPAEAYAQYQLAFAETVTAFGGSIQPSYVYLSSDGVLLCLLPEQCVDVTGLEVVDGRLTDFAVDGNDIAPRLARPGAPVTVGPVTAQVVAAYRAVTQGDALRVYLDLSSAADASFELSKAVYVDPDGNVVPVDTDTSLGAVDGTARAPVTVALDFPAADPGGELRFLVFPRGAESPLAVVLPVEALAPA